MVRPLRTLFYGMSHEHAPGKLDSLRKMPDDFEIVAVADDRARRTPTYFPPGLATRPEPFRVVSEEEALAMEDIDCVFIETANADLMEIAAHFAARGIPMHCDKPCGESLPAYRAVVETCRAKGIPCQIGYVFRHNPAVQFCQRAVREGWLGDLTFVSADMCHAYGDPDYQRYVSTFRGGVLYNLGGHLLDIILPMLPAGAKPEDIYPVIATAPGDLTGAPTRCSALLRYPTLDVLVRTCSHTACSSMRRHLRIDGTAGAIELQPMERFDGKDLALTLHLSRPAGGYVAGTYNVSFGAQSDRYIAQLHELAQIVRGELPNDNRYDHDLAVHELLLAACGG